MNTKFGIRLFLWLTLGLPLVQTLLSWVAGLLRAMEDTSAAEIVTLCATIAGIAWLVSLTALVVTLAVRAVELDSLSASDAADRADRTERE